MRNFTIVICLALSFFMGFSQTPEQRAKIIANYDLDGSKAVIQKLKIENENREARVNTYLDNISIIEREKIDTNALRDITPNGIPLYYKSHNRSSGITMKANRLYTGGSLGLNLSGANMIAGLWEAENGYPLLTHQDLVGRITVIDGGGLNFHATHVAGTIISSGASTFFGVGRGIAFGASLRAANSDNDLTEMATEAANGLLLSNHSYGLGATGLPLWFFGAYNSDSSGLDGIIRANPYYIAVISAGNDRNDNPAINPTKGGFDLLTGLSTSKNAITSAAVESVINYTGPFSVTMSDFSNFGPTDDGRIKPDISSMGVDVNSTSNASNTAYSNSSGTSMSAPSITGLLLLLQEHYNNVNSSFMLAATAKGLLLHTADEAGLNQGPDYGFGWGLANGEKMAQAITNSGSSSIVEETFLTNGQTRTFDVVATGGEPLMVSISWTDIAGFPIFNTIDDRTPLLVNDLDLKLTNDTTDYFPWKLNFAIPGNPATRNSTNDVDVFEKVEVDTPLAQELYSVTINHKGTLAASQNYSLVITGGFPTNFSVDDLSFNNSIKLYPNPSNQFINLVNNSSESIDGIQIIDNLGRIIFKDKLNSQPSVTHKLDISMLTEGIYILLVEQKGITTNLKFIVD